MPTLGPDPGKTTSEAEKAARDPAECRSCGEPIYWIETSAGKRMPVNRGRETRVCWIDGVWRTVGAYVSHFATCKQADQWRKKK